MMQRSCICNNDLTDILLKTSKDINVHINLQLELVDNINAKSTSEINAIYTKISGTHG